MTIRPILSTLRRHRTAATLIVLQIALTCAIVSNAIFLIGGRLDRLELPSGVVEDELIRVQITSIGEDPQASATTDADLAALAALPGVKAVANTNMVPFGQSSWNSGIGPVFDDVDAPNAAMWVGSPGLLETFGVKLIAGRDFEPSEYQRGDEKNANTIAMPSVILTKALAERLFPGESAVGKQVYGWGEKPQIVVGVIDRLSRPNAWKRGAWGHNDDEYAAIFPAFGTYTIAPNYVLRVDPAEKQALIKAASEALLGVNGKRILLDRNTFGEMRAKYFEEDRSMAYLLVGVCVALLVITALGIVGLASFWVQQRTRQIGIRRALGASRGQILEYFHTENFLLATAGIVVGMLAAFGINQWLMSSYDVPRLPGVYLPIGAILLWVLGQIAVFGPAIRAASVPPAVATRTV